MTWQEEFKKQGYALFPRCADEGLVKVATEAIAKDYKENYDPALQLQYDGISYCPGLQDKNVIMDLLHKSLAWDILDETLGVSNIRHGVGQVAIRWAHNTQKAILEPHLDGVPSPYNGLQGTQIDNFTALIGVYLTNMPQPSNAGNFSVWPGSHVRLEQYFRERGSRAMNESFPQIDYGEPRQLNTRAGDIILCHYQLVHGVAPNLSDIDRPAVYFRIYLKGINPSNRWEYLTNIWKDWRLQNG